MISEKQLIANRNNAKHSTGPRSEKGKRTSSHNALRHGFTGHVVILTPEDREAHDRFCGEIIDSLRPETAIERQLAHSVAEDHWRTNRLRAAENNILASACSASQGEIETALDTAGAFLREAKQLQLLSLYEQRINRAIQKNLDQLRHLQTDRKAERQRQLEEAMLLAQLSLSKGIPYNPAVDFPVSSSLDAYSTPASPGQGFVYSSAEINRAIDRKNRLDEAKIAAAAGKPALSVAGRAA